MFDIEDTVSELYDFNHSRTTIIPRVINTIQRSDACSQLHVFTFGRASGKSLPRALHALSFITFTSRCKFELVRKLGGEETTMNLAEGFRRLKPYVTLEN